MLPFCFEWHWDVGHVIFFGLFYMALTVISLGLAYCFGKTFYDLYTGAELHHEEEDEGPTYTFEYNRAAKGYYA
jgi:hypothetical protein